MDVLIFVHIYIFDYSEIESDVETRHRTSEPTKSWIRRRAGDSRDTKHVEYLCTNSCRLAYTLLGILGPRHLVTIERDPIGEDVEDEVEVIGGDAEEARPEVV